MIVHKLDDKPVLKRTILVLVMTIRMIAKLIAPVEEVLNGASVFKGCKRESVSSN